MDWPPQRSPWVHLGTVLRVVEQWAIFAIAFVAGQQIHRDLSQLTQLHQLEEQIVDGFCLSAIVLLSP